jgi:ribonuclease-3
MPQVLSAEQRKIAEEALGYCFKNEALLTEALTHASIADNRLHSNERMEFLGDAVLDLIVCHDIYTRFPTFTEGELTKLKSAVVSRKTCAEVSRELGMDRLLIIGKGISNRQQIPHSLSAAVYESIVAAIYLDGGYATASEFVLRTMSPKILAISSNLNQHNFKAMLQQHAQGQLNATPIYELLDEKGPDHSKCFEMCVNLNGRRFESAWGINKKLAEQKAAVIALRELGILSESETASALESVGSVEPQFID